MKLQLIVFILLALTPFTRGQSTIDSANRFAHGANVGWMDWRADATSGAVIGEYVCSGFIYAANIGWIINWYLRSRMGVHEFGLPQAFLRFVPCLCRKSPVP